MLSKKRRTVKILKQNVGVDISKDEFKVSFWQLLDDQKTRIKGTRTFKNNLSGFKAFLNWIIKKTSADCSVQITMEATGVYHEQLTHFLYDQSYRVNVILPNMGKSYAKSLNLKTKTDKVDANMLGQLGIERDLFQWKPASENMRTIKQLCRSRVQILTEKTAIENKKHALSNSYQPNKAVVKRMQQRIKLLEKQIKAVELEIEQAIRQDEQLSQKVDNICKAKGLGIITVATVIAETNGFELFTSRGQVVSFVGYDVVQRESGSSIKGKTKISKKGNKYIRRALYFPAISVVTHEPQFKQMFERIVKKSGVKMVAYVAVQRKILLLIYTLFKSGNVYDTNYYKNNQSQEKPELTPA